MAELRAQQGREPQAPSSRGQDPSLGAAAGWPRPGARRRDAGPCRQRRHPHPRRCPPSPPPLRVTGPGWRGPPVDRVVFPFFKFRPRTKLARGGGALMWSREHALGQSRRKSGAKEDASGMRLLTRFELVLTYLPINTPKTKKPKSSPKSPISRLLRQPSQRDGQAEAPSAAAGGEAAWGMMRSSQAIASALEIKLGQTNPFH